MFDTEKFIRVVEQQPAIYDMHSKYYSSRQKKVQCWSEVGEALYENWHAMTPEEQDQKGRELSKKWKAIRDNFVREVKRTETGETTTKKRKYVYYVTTYPSPRIFVLPTNAREVEMNNVGDPNNGEDLKDINDVFESIAFSDDTIVKDGFDVGFQKGAEDGKVEGFHLGYHRGIELGTEIGFYEGFATMWLSMKDSGKGQVNEKAEKGLHRLLEMINEFPTVNVEDVDIISFKERLRSQYKKVCALLKNLWKCHVSEGIQKEAQAKKLEEMFNLFWQIGKEKFLQSSEVKMNCDESPFSGFLNGSYQKTLPHSGLVMSVEEYISTYCNEDQNAFKLDQFMSQKKMHEVKVMSRVVALAVHSAGVSHVVDIGSGKGYLGSLLALYYKLNVLGLDASQTNTHGAEARTQKLERIWQGLSRRANDIAEGRTPSRRGKHRKAKKHSSSKPESGNESEVNADQLETGSVIEPKVTSSHYRPVTTFVTEETRVTDLVKQNFDTDDVRSVGVVGLHTCGNLAPSCLQMFVRTPEASLLCNVGCCYHLLKEEYFQNPFWTDMTPAISNFGFPMSDHLKKQKFVLGYNARNLASQSVTRIVAKNELPSKSLFYRSLLQVLLQKKCNQQDIPEGQVRGLGSKCDDFSSYVCKAFEKLGVTIEVSDTEIEELYEEYLPQLEKLQLFYLMKVSLAPVIETVVLLDRLLYLYEQGIHDAHIVQMFDPVVSPRCYGIVATKPML